jgi:PIN domain nuclease of toxin-antitoxin system
MDYLLDTHALLWAIGSPDRLSPAARAAVETGRAKVSVVSLWELIVKKNRNTAPIREPLSWWQRHIARAETEVVAIRVPHLAELDRLPQIHGDPFDRMLVAQARSEQLRLVTADAALGRYDVAIVW